MLLAQVLLTAWLSHPLIASLQSFVAKARRARGKSPNLGTHGVLPKPPTSFSESRPPMSKKRPTEIAETRGGHITLLVFVLISACCVDLLDIVHQNVPTKENECIFHLANVHLVHTLWAVQCSMPGVVVQRLKKPKIKTT